MYCTLLAVDIGLHLLMRCGLALSVMAKEIKHN